jgi:transaldolase
MIKKLKVKIFSDGADKTDMLEMYSRDYIKGLTTNPTLMKKAGIKSYVNFCKDILKNINDKPISFEVFSDNFNEMERQAREIATWGKNVYVKIPVMNSDGENTYSLIKNLANDGIKLNITAIMTTKQVSDVVKNLNTNVESYISVFAGRIADTGVDPINIIKKSLEIMKSNPKSELIWASPREVLNVIQADEIGCHIITVTKDIINKFKNLGYDLDKFSLDTVKMFSKDAKEAGYKI